MSFVALIDCGSNSFHLMIVKVNLHGEFEIVERSKGQVQLREGLEANGTLSLAAQMRALQCLKKFRSILDRYPIEKSRVVGTYTLRAALGIESFIQKSSDILGLSLEIISGEEEARLIHQGALSLGPIEGQYLIIDIGGGSTELILGQKNRLLDSISLEMGCVEYQLKFFNHRKISAQAFDDAIESVKKTVAPFANRFSSAHFKRCLGGSGTLRGLMSILFGDAIASSSSMTYRELKEIQNRLIQIEDFYHLSLKGLRADRYSVIAGGLSVLLGIFEMLQIEKIELSCGALREGLLRELFD